jgi:branched-chain amino acid transport system permease protein
MEQQILNGLTLGGTYALAALAYTLTYAVLGTINFAQGQVYMVGGFVTYWAASQKFSWIVCLLLAAVVGAILNALIEVVGFRPLRRAPLLSVFITGLGLSLVVQGLMFNAVGPKTFTLPEIGKRWQIGSLVVTPTNLIIIAATIGLAGLTTWVLAHTGAGWSLRAVSANRDAAEIIGMPTKWIVTLTFAAAGALSGIAGGLVAYYFNSINVSVGLVAGIIAFTAAILGGIGSVPGAVLGGLLIGLSQVGASAYISSALRDAVAYTILLFFLIVRPSGFFGRELH